MDHQHEVSKLLDNLQVDIETVRNRIASPQAGSETVRNRIASPTTNSILATNSISTTTRITEENVNNQLRYHHDYF